MRVSPLPSLQSVLQERGVLNDKVADVATLLETRGAGAPEMNTHEHS